MRQPPLKSGADSGILVADKRTNNAWSRFCASSPGFSGLIELLLDRRGAYMTVRAIFDDLKRTTNLRA